MGPAPLLAALLSPLLVSRASCQTVSFTVSNGQIFTPGFVVVDAPQPGTSLGGAEIEVAIDVTANGILPLDVATDSPSRVHDIAIFLSSYETGRNFTIANGSVATATYGPIMLQESGSTVKHVKWTWPACLVGDGYPESEDSDRGIYNVSIRQNFRMNNTEFYTIFDLPISVSNSIDDSVLRPSCDSLNNAMMTPEQINAAAANAVGVLFAPGGAQSAQFTVDAVEDTVSGQGLGGAATLKRERSATVMCSLALVVGLFV